MNKQTLKKIWNEWIVTLAIAFAVAFFFRTTLFSPRHIPTGSMIPTIKIGEFIFVNMFAYDWHIPFTRKSFVERKDPQRGDIAVFEYPMDPSKDYIKRVIAIPGDTVEIRDRQVIVNGKPYLSEPLENKSLLDDLRPKYRPETMSLLREQTGEVWHYIAHLNDKEPYDMPPQVVPERSFFRHG